MRTNRLQRSFVAALLTLLLSDLLIVRIGPAWAASGAQISLSVTVGPPTTHTTIDGSGFTPGERVDLLFDSSRLLRTAADSHGTFDVGVTVPGRALPGPQDVRAIGSAGSGATTVFTVRTDWLQPKFDAAGTGSNPYENTVGPANVKGLRVKWRAPVADNVYTQPVVADGITYVGVGNIIQAFDSTTGSLLWSSGDLGDIPPDPAVVDGLVITMDDFHLVAFDALTGNHVWSSGPFAYISGGIKILDGRIYVGTTVGVYVFDETNGALIWRARIVGYIISTPAISDGVVYVGGEDGGIFALDAGDGHLLWTGTTGDISFSSPAVAYGLVYVGSEDGNLYAFSAAGCGLSVCLPTWVAPTDGPILSSPAVADGMVFVGSEDSRLYAFRATNGKRAWSAGVGYAAILNSPIVANDVVYMAAQGIYAYDAATGTRLWAYPTNSQSNAAPAIADGVLYSGDFGGNVWAFALGGP